MFQGKVIVAPGAQKSDGGMKSHAILLSDQATMNHKPELEIFADDVVCGRGATTGELDENATILRSIARPAALPEAEALLLEAFAGEAIGRIVSEPLARVPDAGRSHPGSSERVRSDGPSRSGHRLIRPCHACAGIFQSLRWKSTASRSSISTTPASAREAEGRPGNRMAYAYTHEYANVHRGLHYLANAATEGYEGAREKVRGFLNAGSAEEIIFTRSATESINLVAASYGLEHIGTGDEIVLSIMEHHSNIVPWYFHRERKGAVLKWVGVDDEGNFRLDEFEQSLSDRTKIVAITHMSNVLGTQ